MTQNFTLKEFIRSTTARRYDIQNIPSESHIQNIRYGIEHILQPLRDYVHVPIRITSGYRNTRVNDLVGGVASSHHTTGEAADFHISGYTINQAIKIIIDMKLPYDQLINEYDSWVHLGWRQPHRYQGLYFYRDNGITKRRELEYAEL